jgi:hypothetical protein
VAVDALHGHAGLRILLCAFDPRMHAILQRALDASLSR